VRKFLGWCNEHFEVAIWTTANDSYAHEMVECIIPSGMELAFLWCEDECTMVDHDEHHVALIKDLSRLDSLGVPLHEIVVIEDTPQKIAFHPENVMRIAEFRGDRGDRELQKAQRFLDFLRLEKSVYKAGIGDWQAHPSAVAG
jgi:RNA polymerase II subunit A small phosphatase-like protein